MILFCIKHQSLSSLEEEVRNIHSASNSGVLPRIYNEFITLGAKLDAGTISVTNIIGKLLFLIVFVTSQNLKFDNTIG